MQVLVSYPRANESEPPGVQPQYPPRDSDVLTFGNQLHQRELGSSESGQDCWAPTQQDSPAGSIPCHHLAE